MTSLLIPNIHIAVAGVAGIIIAEIRRLRLMRVMTVTFDDSGDDDGDADDEDSVVLQLRIRTSLPACVEASQFPDISGFRTGL